MWVEGRYHDAMNEHEEAIKTYQALYSFFPDNLEYGLQLASAQTAAGKGTRRTGDDRFVAAPAGAGQRRSPNRQRRSHRRQFVLRLQASAGRRGSGGGKGTTAGRSTPGCRAPSSRKAMRGRNWETRQRPSPPLKRPDRFTRLAGDRGGESRALRAAGIALRSQGDLAGARQMYEQGLGVAREIGDQSTTAVSLNNIANVLRQQGSLDAAQKTYAESLAISREIGDRSAVALILNNIAIVLRVRGDSPEPRRTIASRWPFDATSVKRRAWRRR